MKRPEMIIFDYGHTLYDEKIFDVSAGDRAIIEAATKNPQGVTAEALTKKSLEMEAYIGRYTKGKERDYLIEVHHINFTRYLYDYFDLSFDQDLEGLEYVFWQGAAPATPTPHIHELLAYLKASGIRTGVISNLSFSGKTLRRRLGETMDTNQFEFILSTADYLFRKPSAFIFELALKKAGLSAEQVWYCGDNVWCDVAGAKTVGIQPVWYTGANSTGVYQSGLPGDVAAPEVPEVAHLNFDDWRDMMAYLKA